MDLPVSEVASLVKGGETRIMIELRRIPRKVDGIGVRINVKLHPLVEEFMRDLGHGEKVEVGAFGRHWASLDRATPLLAYDLAYPLEVAKTQSGLALALDRLGSPLSERDGRDRYDTINMSFLRLVGSSEGSGASFLLKGVYSTEGLKRTRDQITEAAFQFYVSYLKPINLAVMVSTQEI